MVVPVVSIVVWCQLQEAGDQGLTVTALRSSAEAAFSDRKSDVFRIWDFDGFDSTALLGIEGHHDKKRSTIIFSTWSATETRRTSTPHTVESSEERNHMPHSAALATLDEGQRLARTRTRSIHGMHPS